MARKVVVTSTSDNESSPTSGMLRYLVDNAQLNDTITFNVSTVNLVAQIDVASSIVIDGGTGMVTIDGGANDRIFNVTSYSSTTKIVIKNLKLINGKEVSDYGWGGAMYVFATSGSVNVDNCIFSNNEAVATDDGQGGALRNQGGTFTNCSFFNNKVSGSAGPQGGGAVQAIGGLFINCVFSNNQAKWGGGVYASNNAQFFNCTFTNNKATSTSSAGGIQSEEAEFVNCISYNNSVNGSESNINAISNSVIKNCAMESSNSFVGTNGNIGLSSSPFKGGNGADSLTLIDGPCVNAGTTTGITVLSIDILGNIRITGSAIDLGAYEFNSTPLSTSVFTSVYKNTVVLYPNPSKGTVYFNNGILQTNNIEVEVYDLTGKLILTQSQTNSPLTIAEPGLYQVKVKSNNSVYYQKIIIE